MVRTWVTASDRPRSTLQNRVMVSPRAAGSVVGVGQCVYATYPTPGRELASQVVSVAISLDGRPVTVAHLDDSELITIKPPLLPDRRRGNKKNKPVLPKCGFWNVDINDWDGSGCQEIVSKTGEVTCLCDHLTDFSVVLESQNMPDQDADDKRHKSKSHTGRVIGIVVGVVVGLAVVVVVCVIVVVIVLAVSKSKRVVLTGTSSSKDKF